HRGRARVDAHAGTFALGGHGRGAERHAPWVIVGPSSTQRTQRPAIGGPSSTVIGDAARTIVAAGFTTATSASTRSSASGPALSPWLTTPTSASRRLASPGW